MNYDMFRDVALQVEDNQTYQTEVRRSKRASATSHKDNSWYKVSEQFWQEQEASDVGMSLGYPHLFEQDLQFSRSIIEKVKYKFLRFDTALDCGAGTGRVTKDLLTNYFTNVDLVEPIEKHINQAKKNLEDSRKLKQGRGANKFYQMGLQDFRFHIKYDCIWSNWSLCFLTDSDLFKFLNDARMNLRKAGKKD